MSHAVATPRLRLRAIEQKDYSILHRWRNQPRYIRLCSDRRAVVSYDQFVDELKLEFSRSRHSQFLIERTKDGISIGTVFAYGLNLSDGHVFVTIYVDEQYEYLGYGPEAFSALLLFLFDILPLRKVYLEVFSYNHNSLSTIQGAGLTQEGCFREHRFFDGKYWDIYRFAILRSELAIPTRFLDRLRRRVALSAVHDSGSQNDSRRSRKGGA